MFVSTWMKLNSWVQKLWAMSGADPAVGRGAGDSHKAVLSPGAIGSPGVVNSGRQEPSKSDVESAGAVDSENGYISDVRDLYHKARAYFHGRGGPTSINSEDETVCLVLYGVKEFRLAMPEWHWTSLAFQYRVSEHRFTQKFLGTSLTFVENTKEDVERAFDVLDEFARLQLPDKYLDAWEASRSDRE